MRIGDHLHENTHWLSYFRLIQVKGILEDLDGWIRRKLRCLLWRQSDAQILVGRCASLTNVVIDNTFTHLILH